MKAAKLLPVLVLPPHTAMLLPVAGPQLQGVRQAGPGRLEPCLPRCPALPRCLLMALSCPSCLHPWCLPCRLAAPLPAAPSPASAAAPSASAARPGQPAAAAGAGRCRRKRKTSLRQDGGQLCDVSSKPQHGQMLSSAPWQPAALAAGLLLARPALLARPDQLSSLPHPPTGLSLSHSWMVAWLTGMLILVAAPRYCTAAMSHARAACRCAGHQRRQCGNVTGHSAKRFELLLTLSAHRSPQLPHLLLPVKHANLNDLVAMSELGAPAAGGHPVHTLQQKGHRTKGAQIGKWPKWPAEHADMCRWQCQPAAAGGSAGEGYSGDARPQCCWLFHSGPLA